MTLVLGVVAGLVVIDRWWPVPDVVAAAPVAAHVAGRTQLVCAGPPVAASQDDGFSFDPDFDPGAGESATLIEGFVLGRPGTGGPAWRLPPDPRRGARRGADRVRPRRRIVSAPGGVRGRRSGCLAGVPGGRGGGPGRGGHAGSRGQRGPAWPGGCPLPRACGVRLARRGRNRARQQLAPCLRQPGYMRTVA